MSKKKPIQSTIYRITGSPYSVILERRILRAVSFVSSLISFLLFLFAIIFKLSVSAWLIPLIAAAIYFGIYTIVSGHSISQAPAFFFITITHLIALSLWFYMGGIHSLGIPILIIVVGFLPVLLKKRVLFAGTILSLLAFTAVFISGIYHSEQLNNPFTEVKFFFDWLLDRIFLAYGLSGMLYMIMHSYRLKVKETNELNATLTSQNTEISLKNLDLKKAMEEISALRGIIPICSYCHKVRTDSGYEESVEAYISKHTNADFSHTCCPDCLEKYFPEIDSDNSRQKEKGKEGRFVPFPDNKN